MDLVRPAGMIAMQPIPTNDLFAAWRPLQPPASLYLHIPFCRQRCGYCNFSLVAGRDYLIERFLEALAVEISWLDQCYPLKSLFLGGGTPSHLSPEQLRRLRDMVASRFELDPDTEVTAECNPNDLDEEKSAALATFGVNRISLGVQSLDPVKLQRLERDHQPDDVIAAVENSRKFARSVSLDLIFAAPEETIGQWETDLDAALTLQPDHLSTYELTFEKGTQFWNRKLHHQLTEADEDLRAEMYEVAISKLSTAGLAQYEISSFARHGHVCRHNEVYWQGDSYFAFGPGASRYVDGCRQTNHSSTLRYLKSIEEGVLPIATSERLSPVDSARELLAIGLRRVVGVADEAFNARTGFAISDLLDRRAGNWIEQGLLINQHGIWSLTDRGRLVADWLATSIIGADGERG